MDEKSRPRDRSAGIAIGVASLLSVALMAHHPSTSARDLAGVVEEMSREAPAAGAVHGGLIALMVVLLFGFSGFVSVLGWPDARVRVGAIAYTLGVLGLIGAALVSGFVAPGLATAHVGATDLELAQLRPLLRLCWEANQVLAKAGLWAISGAIIAWSLALLGRGAGARGLGVAGLVVGALPVLGLLSGHLVLHVHGMMAVLVAQTLWNLLVAWWLLRPAGPHGLGSHS